MITIIVDCDNNLTMTHGPGKGRLRITLPNVDEEELLNQLDTQKKDGRKTKNIIK